jgi:periplasmic protein TonB
VAQTEERRDHPRQEATATQAPVQATATVAPPVAAPQIATQTTAPPPAPVAVAIREGDVVDMSDLDRAPAAVREPRPVYPAIAARQRMEATIMASIFISETGEVLDVKILRGDPRFGFNDAAIRAFRGARYSPAIKDGKRVKTWIAQMIQFKP